MIKVTLDQFWMLHLNFLELYKTRFYAMSTFVLREVHEAVHHNYLLLFKYLLRACGKDWLHECCVYSSVVNSVSAEKVHRCPRCLMLKGLLKRGQGE